MKKILFLILSLLLVGGCTNKEAFPLPQVSEGLRGQLGIDANINEATIDNYLNIEDALYYDMRMLKDDAEYENIGGDSYLSGFVNGFEVLPFPYLCTISGLPEEVGKSYNGETLYTLTSDGEYIPNYEESYEVLEYFFPKDKIIFLMCGGGGYAGLTKNMLITLGWDETKIYNVGAYWSYEGNNNVKVKTTRNNKIVYDFWKIPYHDINFKTLHKLEQ
ncbi:MAG: hypothetical protein GX265_01700 [Mollicutes bacterium]|nr:hypothetical protein [Mollicutes bacterium]